MTAYKGKIVKLLYEAEKYNVYQFEHEDGNIDEVKSKQEYDIEEPALLIWSDMSEQYNTTYLKRRRGENDSIITTE
jgi:hypothetical protein